MLKKAVKFVVIVAVLAAAGFLYLAGFFESPQARRAYYKAKGVAGSVLDTSVPSGGFEAAAQCRANLKRIESGKRLAAQKAGMAVGVVSIQQLEAAMGHKMPRCPGGGTYSIESLVQLPRCTLSGKGTLDKRDDHILVSF